MSLVSEKVDFLELLVCDMPQAESLVPPVREHIKGDFAAYGEREAVVGELLPQHLDERDANPVLL